MRKSSCLLIHATEQEKVLIQQAAKRRNISVNQFVLQASLDAAHTILSNQTRFYLSAEQWEAFSQRLDEQPQKIAALQKLFSEPQPF